VHSKEMKIRFVKMIFVKNRKTSLFFFFSSGVVVPGNLPIGKIQKILNGQIVMGNLPR